MGVVDGVDPRRGSIPTLSTRSPSFLWPQGQADGTNVAEHNVPQALVFEDEWEDLDLRAKREALQSAIQAPENSNMKRQEFRARYYEAVKQCTYDDEGDQEQPGSIFDFIAQVVSSKRFETHELYRELVEMALERLTHRYSNNGLRNCLHGAIKNKHWTLIKVICRVPHDIDAAITSLNAIVEKDQVGQGKKQKQVFQAIGLMEGLEKGCFKGEEERKCLADVIASMRVVAAEDSTSINKITGIIETLEYLKEKWPRQDDRQKNHIADAIASVDPHTKQNCLHAAIAQNAPLAVVDALVQYAEREAFKKSRDDNVGNTPLHDFVEFREWSVASSMMMLCNCQCRLCLNDADTKFANKLAREVEYTKEFRLTMVRMIQGYEGSLSTLNKAGKTPYVLHRESRGKVVAAQDDDWADIEYEEVKTPDTKAHDSVTNVPSTPVTSSAPLFPQLGESAKGKVKLKTGLLPPTNVQSRPAKGQMYKKDSQREEPHAHKFKDSWTISRYFAQSIAAELLERCSSRSSWDEAVTSLFGEHKLGDETRRQTSFTIEGALYEGITEYYDFLDFNPILKWVELKLDNQPVATRPALDATVTIIPGIGGSTDQGTSQLPNQQPKMTPQASRNLNVDCLQNLLEWLRKKGVKRILKLVVRDDQEWQCTDDTIQSCLKDWNIRYLDWNKRDLSIDLIHGAGSKELVELWLNWSGQNTALLGWADPTHGLKAVLPKLRQVHISVKSSTEPVTRMNKNLSNFKTLLSMRFTALKFNLPTNVRTLSSGVNNNRDHTSNKNKHDHRWMAAVDHFRQEAILPSFYQMQKNSHVREYLTTNPIKVALIDDGVTPDQLHFRDTVREGWPLDVLSEDQTISTYFRSRDGHGTVMANLIHHVCPFAHFYVAKLEKTAPKPYKSVAHMAAEAVKWAVSRNVDVISMSWTIKASDENSQYEAELNRQIVAAGERGIILFCSFNDKGQYADQGRLPSPNKQFLRRVGSCNSDGKESSFVNKVKVDYLLPGEQFQRLFTSTTEDSMDRGSSASTALASGLAATILWCVARVSGKEEDRMAWANAMYAVFDKLKTGDSRDHGSLVDVSGLMDNARASGEGALQIVKLFVKSLRDKLNDEEWNAAQKPRGARG